MTGAGRGLAWGGAAGGCSAGEPVFPVFPLLALPPLFPLVPLLALPPLFPLFPPLPFCGAGAGLPAVAPRATPAWCPGSALATYTPIAPTAATVPTAMAAVMLESLVRAASRRSAATWRRWSGPARRTLPMKSRVRTESDAYMKKFRF